MHDALVAAGRRTALVVFDGEGHGFRRAETIRQAWAVELGFYGEVWGFEPDGGAEVEVANL
jgi:dipeptidyl aminopeptidase/acylaminoacyl peptidase